MAEPKDIIQYATAAREIFDSLPPKTWDVAGWDRSGDWSIVRTDQAEAHRLIIEVLRVIPVITRKPETCRCKCDKIQDPDTTCPDCKWGHTTLRQSPAMITATEVQATPRLKRYGCACGGLCDPGHCINVPC